jgi:hypothetical protein
MHEQGAAEPSDAHATYVPYEYPGEYEARTVEHASFPDDHGGRVQVRVHEGDRGRSLAPGDGARPFAAVPLDSQECGYANVVPPQDPRRSPVYPR